MIVHIDSSAAVTLSGLDDFRHFHAEIGVAKTALASVQQALHQRACGVRFDESPDFIWIDADTLLDLGSQAKGDDAPAWRDQTLKMIDGARKYGWVRESPLAVRAHIVWPG